MQLRRAPSKFRRGFCELPIQLTCKSGLPSGRGPCVLGGFGGVHSALWCSGFPRQHGGSLDNIGGSAPPSSGMGIPGA